jgi:hypothetical protein
MHQKRNEDRRTGEYQKSADEVANQERRKTTVLEKEPYGSSPANNRPKYEQTRPYAYAYLASQYLILLVAAGGIGVAISSLRSLNQSVDAANRQAVAAATQARTAQQEFELSERPWVAVDRITLLEAPTWETLQGPRILGRPEQRTFINLHAKIAYRLNNFGKSPAIKTFSEAQATFTEDWTAKNYEKPLGAMEITCAGAEAESRKAGNSTKQFSEGAAIFPQVPLDQNDESSAGLPENLKQIDHIWIVACVAYQDGITQRIHHTKLWYRSIASDQTMTHYVPVASGESVMWMPPAGFVLTDSAAD